MISDYWGGMQVGTVTQATETRAEGCGVAIDKDPVRRTAPSGTAGGKRTPADVLRCACFGADGEG